MRFGRARTSTGQEAALGDARAGRAGLAAAPLLALRCGVNVAKNGPKPRLPLHVAQTKHKTVMVII